MEQSPTTSVFIGMDPHKRSVTIEVMAADEAIQEADTMGVFQIESRAQMQSLYRTRPENLDDLTIQVAIVRPGPILGCAVNPYIARKKLPSAQPDSEAPTH